jgi:DNA-binding MarR family transcriptional regulator
MLYAVTPTIHSRSKETGFDHQVDAVMDAALVMNSIVGQSVKGLEPTVTISQLRVLVMLSVRGPLNLSSVAAGLGVHPSNATRVCARLAELDLLTRRSRTSDRRNVELLLTARGRRTVSTVMRRRRVSAEQILAHLPHESRQRLAKALHEFTIAAAEVSEAYAVVLDDHPAR